jgi:hypothetical protein
MRRSRKKNDKLDEATSELTPRRGGDFAGGDTSLRDEVPDPGTVQSNHAMRGYGGDDERADADEYKVKGRSRG